MSAHLGILARGGLVRSERHSGSIIYRADLDDLRTLTLFLVRDYCPANVELCAPADRLAYPLAASGRCLMHLLI
jgi:DNA-binding transcriptional ArsR family regulator